MDPAQTQRIHELFRLETLEISEEDLAVGVFDEEIEIWEEVVAVDIDTENNTITVATDHFSLWGVIEAADIPTLIRESSWGEIKKSLK